jgi:hypothetical protein
MLDGGGETASRSTQKVDRGVGDLGSPGVAGVLGKQWLASALVAGTSTRLNSIGDRFSLDTDLTTWLEWRGSLRGCFEDTVLELLITVDLVLLPAGDKSACAAG